jgi:alkyldihydroxyacetonephosphate synthase
MNLERLALRWNGWGPVDTPDPLYGREGIWPWFAERLRCGALPHTPSIAIEDVVLAPSRITPAVHRTLAAIVGETNLATSPRARIAAALGRSYIDLVRLRGGDLGAAPDLVLAPGSAAEVLAVLQAADRAGLALVPRGGGSSVVGGVTAKTDPRPSIVVDLCRLDQILAIDEISMTARLQPGAFGPALEAGLNARGFTLGHFPQSFEHSTLGGWIAHRGSGQQSLLYGRAEDWFVAATLATPRGFWHTESFPASAAGPRLGDLVVGSEGTLGIITEATVRLRRQPPLRDYRGYLLPSFVAGADAVRALAQGTLRPAMARLSDEDESEFYASFRKLGRAPGIKDKLTDAYLAWRGVPGRFALLVLGFEGEAGLVKFTRREAERHVRLAGGIAVGASPGRSWYAGRFHGPHLRDPLLDRGLGVDTLETATSWSNFAALHAAVRSALAEAIAEVCPRPGVRPLVMGHLSHSYPDGASLYFTFVWPRDLAQPAVEWHAIKSAVSDAITRHGGTISHHHGIGTDHAPWLAAEKGPIAMDLLRAVKTTLDPNRTLNPGKLGL